MAPQSREPCVHFSIVIKSPAMWNQTRVSERLGIRYPIIQGPFGGGLSTIPLTAVISNAGGMGSFGAHHLSPVEIKETVAAIRSRTNEPSQ